MEYLGFFYVHRVVAVHFGHVLHRCRSCTGEASAVYVARSVPGYICGGR